MKSVEESEKSYKVTHSDMKKETCIRKKNINGSFGIA